MARSLALGLLMALSSSALADDVVAPTCVEVTKSAPVRGFGHAHIVHIRNTCDSAVRCSVATDVDPSRQSVEVDADASRDVVTRIGSPASTFEARVDCETRP